MPSSTPSKPWQLRPIQPGVQVYPAPEGSWNGSHQVCMGAQVSHGDQSSVESEIFPAGLGYGFKLVLMPLPDAHTGSIPPWVMLSELSCFLVLSVLIVDQSKVEL